MPGKVELGQGIVTALAQIAADQLDLDVDRVNVVYPSTSFSPDEGQTAGSRSVEESGSAIQQVCAEARALFLAAARETLSDPRQEFEVEDGRIVGAKGESTSYWALADSVDLNRRVTGRVSPKPLGEGSFVGVSSPRKDLAAKVRGKGFYVQNLKLPGMLHARVIRPTGPRGLLVSFEEPAEGGVTVVRNGSFLAVVSESEAEAVRAAAMMRQSAEWQATGDPLPSSDDLPGFMKLAPAESEEVAIPPADFVRPVATLRAQFSRPFIAHASMGPSCAVALWEDGSLRVWSSTQGVYPLRAELARALSTPADMITVQYLEGAGCYGQNGSDDAAYEAALVAQHFPDRPVRLQWMRHEEAGWEPYGPAAVAEVAASLDDAGKITFWNYELWSYGSSGRPGYSKVGPAFWAAGQLEDPYPREHSHLGGATRNIEPGYQIGARRILAHNMKDTSIRTSSLRSLGAHANVFAIESFMDELAVEAGIDPLEFRLMHLDDQRGRTVVERAAADAGWGTQDLPDDHGLGIGYARYKGTSAYCAVVAEVEATSHLQVVKLTIAVDVGKVVNPDGVVNQVAGGAIQATSWTTCERVGYDSDRITSDSWESYPILTFTTAPEVTVALVSRPGDPPMGAGELAQGPTAGAIGNALFRAIGVRVRDMPIDQAAILRALEV